MLNIIKQAYTFDDVLLVPNHSAILPKEVDLSSRFSRNIKLNLPIAAAAMDTVTTSAMAIGLALAGGIGIIHKNCAQEIQAAEINLVKQYVLGDHDSFPNANLDKTGKLVVGAAVGVAPGTLQRAAALIAAGVDVLIVDTAHGHSQSVLDTVALLKKHYPHIDIIGGNVATKEAAEALAKANADGIKVGVGPGSICTTRIVAGVGMPQLTAISDVVSSLANHDIPVIADGGIRFSGDIAKALAAGASSVMLGNLLAGTDEAPGEMLTIDGKQYKSYRGMGSLSAMNAGSADRYFQEQSSGTQNKLVAEGVEARTAYKGSAHAVLQQLSGGLRSAMGYLGCANIAQLHSKARFVTITSAGIKESHVHDVDLL